MTLINKEAARREVYTDRVQGRNKMKATNPIRASYINAPKKRAAMWRIHTTKSSPDAEVIVEVRLRENAKAG